jgi:hypothetical protein
MLDGNANPPKSEKNPRRNTIHGHRILMVLSRLVMPNMARSSASALAVAGLLFFLAGPAMPDTLEVPGDYPTIQDAIVNAKNGDLVLVAPGTYTENINYLGKDITVRSSLGPAVTVIDGGYADTVVKFISGESAQAILDGFTVRNGYGFTLGGGIYAENASPWIQNCILRENDGYVDGGGMYYKNGSPQVSNCLVIHNIALIFDGAGIYCGLNSSGVITNCTFVHNMADPDGWGGALSVVDPRTVISNCVFRHNVAAMGNDIFWFYSQPLIQYCNI